MSGKKKKCRLEASSSVTLGNNNKPFLDWIMTCDKNGFYMTTRDDRLCGWMQKKLQSTSQSQTCTKKMSWSLFDGLPPYDPLQLLHLRSMLSKSMNCPENALQHLEPALVNRKRPVLHDNSQLCVTQLIFKSWTNWAMEFCLILHIHLTSHYLTTTSSSISTTFCRENTSITSRRQKMLSKSASNPKAQIFMLQE